jgi:hypothetical protein
MIEWIAKLCFLYKVADIQRYEKTLVSILQQALFFPSNDKKGENRHSLLFIYHVSKHINQSLNASRLFIHRVFTV